MDSGPFSRNPNLPYSPEHVSSELDSHSFYYKQNSNAPIQLASEWVENFNENDSKNDIESKNEYEYENGNGNGNEDKNEHEHEHEKEKENVLVKSSLVHTKLKQSSPPSGRKTYIGATHILGEDTPTRRSGKVFVENTPTLGVSSIANGHLPYIVTPNPVAASVKTPVFKKASAKKVTTIDVLWAMLNDLTGKDKMAKFAQYSLRLLLHHARKTQRYLSDEHVNIQFISDTYIGSKKVWGLLKNFIKKPQAFAKVLVILICSVFTSRLAGFVPALGLYRQLLRFGKSPFRLHGLIERVKQNMYEDTQGHGWKISEKFFSKSTLGECIAFYYNINDDISLLYKVKLLKNKALQSFARDHEAYAWYCDSWYGLYNAYNTLQKVTQQELDMRITIQVKKRSRILSKQVLGANSLSAGSAHPDEDAKDKQALQEIQFRITNTKLDIYKLISDIIFNSYTVFNAKLHFDTIQIWMGISAAFLSSVKLFREKKKALST